MDRACDAIVAAAHAHFNIKALPQPLLQRQAIPPGYDPVAPPSPPRPPPRGAAAAMATVHPQPPHIAEAALLAQTVVC